MSSNGAEALPRFNQEGSESLPEGSPTLPLRGRPPNSALQSRLRYNGCPQFAVCCAGAMLIFSVSFQFYPMSEDRDCGTFRSIYILIAQNRGAASQTPKGQQRDHLWDPLRDGGLWSPLDLRTHSPSPSAAWLKRSRPRRGGEQLVGEATCRLNHVSSAWLESTWLWVYLKLLRTGRLPRSLHSVSNIQRNSPCVLGRKRPNLQGSEAIYELASFMPKFLTFKLAVTTVKDKESTLPRPIHSLMVSHSRALVPDKPQLSAELSLPLTAWPAAATVQAAGWRHLTAPRPVSRAAAPPAATSHIFATHAQQQAQYDQGHGAQQ